MIIDIVSYLEVDAETKIMSNAYGGYKQSMFLKYWYILYTNRNFAVFIFNFLTVKLYRINTWQWNNN
jgi:hypothetical protein